GGEEDGMGGVSKSVLARFVRGGALSFEEAKQFFGERGVVTGNPVRGAFGALEKKKREDTLNALIFGGSQGARAINNAMVQALPLLRSHRDRLAITAPTGEGELGRGNR